MSNHRNEMTATIDGRVLILRPSFMELERLESIIGIGLLQYLSNIAETGGRSIKVSEVVRILHAAARGGMKDAAPSIEELGDMVLSHGLMESMEIAATFLQKGVLRADAEQNMKEGQAAAGK